MHEPLSGNSGGKGKAIDETGATAAAAVPPPPPVPAAVEYATETERRLAYELEDARDELEDTKGTLQDMINFDEWQKKCIKTLQQQLILHHLVPIETKRLT